MENDVRDQSAWKIMGLLSCILAVVSVLTNIFFIADVSILGRSFTGYSIVASAFLAVLSIFLITLLFLWFFSRQTTANYLLRCASAFAPFPYTCDLHRTKMQYAFEFLGLLLNNNYSYAWLLPSLDKATAMGVTTVFTEDYFGLQLKEWSIALTNRVRVADLELPPRSADPAGEEEQNPQVETGRRNYKSFGDEVNGYPAIISESKYVFITWDLTRLNEWSPQVLRFWLKHLDPMLNELKERCLSASLIVDRILILPEAIVTDSRYRDGHVNAFRNFMDIWQMIGAYDAGSRYSVRFISDLDLRTAALLCSRDKAASYIEDFKDVAFFHKCNWDRTGPVLPSPSELPSDAAKERDFPEYSCVQWSRRHGGSEDGLVELYLVMGKSFRKGDQSLGARRGDAFIASMRRRVKKVILRLPDAEILAASQNGDVYDSEVFHNVFCSRFRADLGNFSELTALASS